MTYDYSAEPRASSRDHYSARPASSRDSSAEPSVTSSGRYSHESPSLVREYTAEPARRLATRSTSRESSSTTSDHHVTRDNQSAGHVYEYPHDPSDSSNNVSESDSIPHPASAGVIADDSGEVGSYSPSSYESLAKEGRSRGFSNNLYKETGGTWPRHSSPFAPAPANNKIDTTFPPPPPSQPSSQQPVSVSVGSVPESFDSSNSTHSNNYSSPTSPHLTSPPPSSDEQTGFYKGRVLEKLALPHQSSPEWVNGTPLHVTSGGVTNGHCTDCDTTEQQLKIGAVNTVREHEARLTNALKNVKSQRVASGYRSDSVIGPTVEHKTKRSHRDHHHHHSNKISNLHHHKSSENLKSSNYVELATFGPPPPKPAVKSFSNPPGAAAGKLGPQSNGYHGNKGGYANGTTRSEPAYVNLVQNAQNAAAVTPVTSSSHLLAKYPDTKTAHPPPLMTSSSTAVVTSSGQQVTWPVQLEPTPVASEIPNTRMETADLAPVPPKRTDSSRFSSRLKRKKENKGTPTPTTPLTTPAGGGGVVGDPKSLTPTNGFFNKASQMFRKRKKERPLTYAELMRLFAPPPPQSLLRAYHTEGARSTDNYTYNVKVGMRISPNPQNKESILSVDEGKSTVLIANETLFFDYVHGPQSKQIDTCSSMLSDVLPAILHGRSVVVVTFGKNSPGRQFSLIGSRDSTQSLGLVPTAVTWLNKLGEDDRSKCGPNAVHITSLRIDEQKCLSEFVSPTTVSKCDDLGKYLDKLTLTLPAREHPNDEALIINMTFSESKSKKKKNKDNFGMLTFIDIGTPIRKNDSSNVLCWQWLQDVTQTSGSKYFETFVQLRHNLMHSKTHITCLGHITHSPKDYQAIGITLNLATRLYMRHLPAHKRNELQRLKREKDYSSATSTGEESADTVIYRPGLSSDGEGPPKSYLPERTKGDGQENSPQFTSCNKRPGGGGRNFSDSEDRVKRAVVSSRNHSDTEDRVKPPRARTGYHSDTGQSNARRGAGYSSDSGSYKPSPLIEQSGAAQSSRPGGRNRQYALTDTEESLRPSGAAPRATRPTSKQFSSDTENLGNAEQAKRRAASKNSTNAEDIRQKRVQKNQQQLKRYFELLRLKNQREAILAQSREMRVDGTTPESTPSQPATETGEKPTAWSAENPAKVTSAAPATAIETEDGAEPEATENGVMTTEGDDKENVKLRDRTRSDSRGKGDNRRLYTIYDTEDDGAVLDKLAEAESKPRRSKSGYRSEGGGVRSSDDKTEISKEWIQKIKKKRQPAPGGKFIDYGPIDLKEAPQIREVKTKRVKSSLSEDELLTRRNNQNSDLGNRNHRYSERRFDKRSGYSTDAPSSGGMAPARAKGRASSGYQSDGAPHRKRHERHAHKQSEKQRSAPVEGDQVEDLELLLEQVQEVEQLVQNKMQWRGAVQDLDYFDQQIRILERRNSLIEKLRRKQFELLSELKATKNNLMSTDWKPNLTVDSTMNENSPGYLSALWTETSNLEVRVNTCKSKILVETSFM